MNSPLLRAVSLGLLWLTASARADLVIPGADGSDGALNITTNTVIDLSQAVTAAWDANNAANAGKGVYDSNKWAVVFKYNDVTIAAGATVSFRNHASRAPVVWLVSGNVAINGVLSLDGQAFLPAPSLAEPGPGGFRGGAGVYSGGVGSTAGFGVGGGGRNQTDDANTGPGGPSTGASYGSQSQTTKAPRTPVYGNPSLIPLIGGSGGGSDSSPNGGGGGGGALLIACAGSILINGELRANGGAGSYDVGGFRGSGSGSGGGIRLVADRLAGVGVVRAIGGSSYRQGGTGRVRIERTLNDNSLTVIPDPSVVDLALGATALLWPPVGAPEVRIMSIGGSNVSVDPRAGFGTVGADVALPRAQSLLVVVETTNVEQSSQVKVRVTPRTIGNYTEATGVVDNVVSASPLVIRWRAELPVQDGYAAVQVKVVRP